jgi:hypothetical protein
MLCGDELINNVCFAEGVDARLARHALVGEDSPFHGGLLGIGGVGKQGARGGPQLLPAFHHRPVVADV